MFRYAEQKLIANIPDNWFSIWYAFRIPFYLKKGIFTCSFYLDSFNFALLF